MCFSGRTEPKLVIFVRLEGPVHIFFLTPSLYWGRPYQNNISKLSFVWTICKCVEAHISLEIVGYDRRTFPLIPSYALGRPNWTKPWLRRLHGCRSLYLWSRRYQKTTFIYIEHALLCYISLFFDDSSLVGHLTRKTVSTNILVELAACVLEPLFVE